MQGESIGARLPPPSKNGPQKTTPFIPRTPGLVVVLVVVVVVRIVIVVGGWGVHQIYYLYIKPLHLNPTLSSLFPVYREEKNESRGGVQKILGYLPFPHPYPLFPRGFLRGEKRREGGKEERHLSHSSKKRGERIL